MFSQPQLLSYSAQDHLVWKVLFDRQMALLHRRAVPAFAESVAQLGLRRDAIPDISALSQQVQAHTGWQLVPTARQVGLTTFFQLLAERKFPVVTRIRAMSEFDFSPEPDLFHDLFGHVPLLLDPAFADFLRALGQAARPLSDTDPAAWRQLWALYFFTAEFGLVLHNEKPRLYGAGLLSSAGEIHHCINELTPRPAFDLATVLRTPVRDTRFQEQYFVLPAWEQLVASVAELAQLVTGEWRVAA